MGHFFTRILGADAVSAGKPDPDGIYEAAAILGVSPFELLVVGDAVSDVHAARAAGSPVICVNYGYNYGTAIQKACPDTTLDTLASLPNIIARPNCFDVPGQGVTTPPVLAGSLRGRAMRPKGGAQF
ncbi:HAD family hydrolase [Salinivibrio socompensis]|uniref:HAD family hydrolase n=1 Tax=Salinivibrio socompensis TaxID=1510206 RepID=UPI0009DFE237|nr:HAD-IA family hydrolase [Salinivibrio socompensis]